jgi:hypothetical protein
MPIVFASHSACADADTDYLPRECPNGQSRVNESRSFVVGCGLAITVDLRNLAGRFTLPDANLMVGGAFAFSTTQTIGRLTVADPVRL